MAEVSGGLGRSLGWSQTQESQRLERGRWIYLDVGVVENAEIRKIPSLLPAPTPTAIGVRAD